MFTQALRRAAGSNPTSTSFRHTLNNIKMTKFTPTRHFSQQYYTNTTTLVQHQLKYTPKFHYKSTLSPAHHTTFRTTRAARDWHQHIDHKTREFYYENIFTGEKTTVQPKIFLPHDAVKESNAMAFLRSDRGALGTHKKKSVLRPVLSVFAVAGMLYTLGEMGYLDKLFGYVPPQRNPPLSERVDLRAKAMLVHYEDWTRKQQ